MISFMILLSSITPTTTSQVLKSLKLTGFFSSLYDCWSESTSPLIYHPTQHYWYDDHAVCDEVRVHLVKTNKKNKIYLSSLMRHACIQHQLDQTGCDGTQMVKLKVRFSLILFPTVYKKYRDTDIEKWPKNRHLISSKAL